MLRIEDDPPARLARKPHAIGDHGQVFLGRSFQHMRHMQGRSLAEDADGRRSRREQSGQRRVVLCAGVLAARAAKGHQSRAAQRKFLRFGEKFRIFGVGAGVARLDERNAQRRQRPGDGQFIAQ